MSFERPHRFEKHYPHRVERRSDDRSTNPEARMHFAQTNPLAAMGLASDEPKARTIYMNSQIVCEGCQLFRSEFEFGGYTKERNLRYQRCQSCRDKEQTQ